LALRAATVGERTAGAFQAVPRKARYTKPQAIAQFQAYGGTQAPPPAAQFDQQPWFTNVESDGALNAPAPSSYGNGGGWAGGFSTTSPQNSFGYSPASLPDEPPLLEELGIDFGEILAKTKLAPARVSFGIDDARRGDRRS